MPVIDREDVAALESACHATHRLDAGERDLGAAVQSGCEVEASEVLLEGGSAGRSELERQPVVVAADVPLKEPSVAPLDQVRRERVEELVGEQNPDRRGVLGRPVVEQRVPCLEACRSEPLALVAQPPLVAIEDGRPGRGEAVRCAALQPGEDRGHERAGPAAGLDEVEGLGLSEPFPALEDLARPEVAEDRMHLG